MEDERRKLTPEQDALEHIASRKDKPFLEGRYIDSFKGRGLFTYNAIKPSMFVVEYRGNIYSTKTTTPHKTCPDSLVNYLFEFSWNGAHWCIDASSEDRSLGRLVNDNNINPNCEMKKVIFEGKPRLCLFAVRNISPGEEITFNYGDSTYPWRSMESLDTSSLSFSDFCATPSTPRAEGDWNPASSFNHSEDDVYDDDDIDELIDSGPGSGGDSFCGTSSQQRRSQGKSGTLMIKPDGASSFMRDNKASSSSSDSEEDQEHRPTGASKKSEDASYATKNFCYFCSAGVEKMARHLLKHVDQDPELARAFSLPTDSRERKKILDSFRTKGNNKHNQEVLKSNCGELKLKRRPTTKGAKSYACCPHCTGMYVRTELWRHMARCPEISTSTSTSTPSTSGRTKILGKIALAESPFAQKLPAAVSQMLSGMKQDEVSSAIQNDLVLLKLAEDLSEKSQNNKRKHEYIRTRLREMGRLLVALQEKSITSFQDAVKPTNFRRVVKVVRKIAGYDTERRSYSQQALALRLGHSLKKIGSTVLQMEANEQIRTDTRTFMKLCTEEWTPLVSQPALARPNGQTSKKPSLIPFTRDVQLFYGYLEAASASAADTLKASEGPQVYAALCRVTLAQVSVLNKCSPAASKMTLQAFQEREDATQVLSKHFIKINTGTGNGQSSAVLLTSHLVSAMMLLINKRDTCGVHKDNPFLFAKPNSSPTSLYRGRLSIHAFSILCQAENPEPLRSPHCHRHVARVFQILTLENDELEHLAKLLGHDIRADKDYYRRPEAAAELAKVAKLIEAMERGSAENSQRGSPEEADIEDEPNVERPGGGISDAKEDDKDPQEKDEPDPGVSDAEEDNEDPQEGEAVEEKQKIEARKKRRLTLKEDASKHAKVRDSGGSCSSEGSNSEEEYVPEGATSSDDSEGESSLLVAACGSSKPRRASSAKLTFDERDSDSDHKPKSQSHRTKNYCFVCGKDVFKISRHLFTHRHDEPEVAEVFKLRKKTKVRKQRIKELRDKGNFEHNEKVLKTGCGELVVKYKKLQKPPATKPCLFCKDIIICAEMKKHLRTCPVKKATESPNCKDRILSVVASAELDNPETSSELSSLLQTLRQDKVAKVVTNDSYLLLMTRYLCHLSGSHTKTKPRLLQRLRAMGTLLLAVKDQESIKSFEDVMKPENFSTVLEAIQELAGFDRERKIYEKPHTMQLIGYSLKYIAEIHYARVLKEDTDKQKIEDAKKLVKLCLEQWCGFYRVKSVSTILFIQDGQLLYQCMEKTAASAFESLTKYECAPVYTALFRVTTAKLSLLNPNVDVYNTTLQSFQERGEAEAAVNQSELEQILHMDLLKFNVMDDKGKKIVMTLTPALLAALELLVSKRDACNVDVKNTLLFAQPSSNLSNVFKRGQCFTTIVARCGAKDKANLRSLFFRKYLTRIFQILSFTNDRLDQLAKLLGRDIQTDSEYYQKPEAAQDIAKILELLSAVETGTVERFEGKSFEEIEISDMLEPVNPEKSDAEDDNEESESSPQKGRSSSKRSSRKKTPGSSSKRLRSSGGKKKKSRRQESENEASEKEEKGKDNENKEQDDGSEERPASPAEEEPQETRTSNRNEDITNMSFSDCDDDMNVDFDVDVDTDEDVPTNEGNDGGDDDAEGSGTKPGSQSQNEDDVDSNSEDHVEEEADQDEEEQSDMMDVDSRSSSLVLSNEKKIEVSAAEIGLKEVKILLQKLDLEKLKASVRRPQPSSAGRGRPVCAEGQKPPKSTNTDNKTTNEKEIQMICSHCKKIMTKGQTAYQKKGFTDVFCSKDCLFQTFPINKPATRSCFQCNKAITQLLDLIMACVDVKGTMKDFCSMSCLCSFKTGSSQTSQQVCSMCNKSGSTKCGLMVKNVFYKFCSESCFEDFRRENLAVCKSCSSTCYKPLKLTLEEETVNMCSQACLVDFKTEIQELQRCTMCRDPRPVSDMFPQNVDTSVVKLFCTRACFMSYKLRPAEEERISSDSDVNKDKQTRCAPTVVVGDVTFCTFCGKTVPHGRKFCPRSCQPRENRDKKKCYNCAEVILRPHSMILAPVDDSGTRKELCSNKCLTSVHSKIEKKECKMCNKCCAVGSRLTMDGLRHSFCSDPCFINYHKVNNLPLVTCDICHLTALKPLRLKTEEGATSVCSDECLVRLKERIRKPQLCSMCQTSHQLSDMVENVNKEGTLNFFCSSRCSMVHKAQSATVSAEEEEEEREEDIKEVKILPNLDFIKQEPVEVECKPNLSFLVSAENVKDEPHVSKEDLKIEEVSSLSSLDSAPAASTQTNFDTPVPCFNCKKVLKDRETVYQKKSHAEIFCSSPCLMKFYEAEQEKTSCTFCLQAITRRTKTKVLQAPVDDEGTMKDFCGQTCMSSFNYKRMMSTKVAIVPVASHSQCNMCSRYCISKHEIIRQDVVHKICSDPCFLRFCNLNKMFICVNCHSNCETPLLVRMQDCSKRLCSEECLTRYKQKIQTPQPCSACSTSLLMTNMIECKNTDGEVEFFCSSGCVAESKIMALSASGAPVSCDSCGKIAVPVHHFSMTDASIRNFCSQSCAMVFKATFKGNPTSTNPAEASVQRWEDPSNPPGELLCVQCRGAIKNTPKVIQEKGNVSFVCSLACSQEFKRVNNIFGKCEVCRSEKIIKIIKRLNDGRSRESNFCSNACKNQFLLRLKKQWGEYCHSCTYCLCISKTFVTERYGRAVEKFCSDDCKLKYSLLHRDLAACDTCGQEGKLRQRIPLIGEVKHFCDVTCVHNFCNQKVKTVSTVSPPPPSVSAAESSPVIANVVSLAEALAKHMKASHGSVQRGSNTQTSVPAPDIQTKTVAHAAIQTVPKELKNKSMLCTPLVHNKGVSCDLLQKQTVDTEVQTDKVVPEEKVLPVPVPVYVPLPMNMYSQYTPEPVGLPIPLPVPVFLPGRPDSLSEAMKPAKKRRLESEVEKVQHDKSMQTDGVETEDGQRRVLENSRNCSSGFLAQPPEETDVSRERQHQLSYQLLPHQDPQISAPSSSTQTAETVHNKTTSYELQQFSQENKKEETHGNFSREPLKLKSQYGVFTWRRWVQWRNSPANPYFLSSAAGTLKEEILHCSAAELSDGLCGFIQELKHVDGEPCSPDSVFYFCLCIQQYLFENGRLENIFSDSIYANFSSEFTKILRGYRPSVAARSLNRFCVEEEFLWECKQLGTYSPIVLLNTLLFFSCKYLGFTTVEQHRQLSFAHTVRRTRTNPDNTKTRFLLFYLPQSTYEAESGEDGVPAKKQRRTDRITMMTENTENLLRCPVRLYEFYLSKCSESVRGHPGLFYLQPDPRCVLSSPAWFSCRPLDDGTMEAMLVQILAVRQMWEGGGGGLNQETAGGDTNIFT
ncbi:uncharacterized protein LOC117827743 isoform X1 [Xyrichtys novacula]|uniref:Uncharacterized protein LOC117827743 isoform X1 n=1 Tax=Xyrichtys novacula TaxID=13765 RepID=A0AAV1HF57_XYRNO|nr:uncharacterized protein LOC117827743 isoform X1 [Xyrichtys novacula]